MKRVFTLLSLLAFVSLVGYIGLPPGDSAAGHGCKTKAECSKMQKSSCGTKCTEDCCCKKEDSDCCKKGEPCDCPCCAKNGCCKKMDKGSCHKECKEDCCCKNTDGKCCDKDGCCKECPCCSKNGCCMKMKESCDKPCRMKTGAAESSPDATLDPVCGMDVVIEDAKYTSEYEGKTYYFCNEFCKKKFDKDPSKFLGE